MSEIKAGVLLSLRDQFSSGMRRAAGVNAQFASSVTGAMARADRAINNVGGALATLGAGVGVGMAVNHVIALEARLTRLGTQAGVSQDRMEALNARIYQVAQAPDIRIDSGSMLDAIDSIIERTGDMQFVEDNLRSIGLAMQATGGDGASIGGLFAEFQKMGLGADEAIEALDTLTLQGKNGAFTLENLAALGPRVISAYTATGRRGADSLREMGAALQVIRQGTGSSEQAATSFEAMMRNLTDPAKQERLRKLGVDVRDVMTGQFRPITEIMREVVERSEGSIEVLGRIFDAEAMRAFNRAAAEFKETGAVESFDRFYRMLGDGTTIEEDAARNAATLAANIAMLKDSFHRLAAEGLSEPLGLLAEKLNELTQDPERVQRAFRAIAIGVGSIAALKIGAGAVGALVNLAKLQQLRAGGMSGGALAPGFGGAQPVLVTNWPSGISGGMPGGRSYMHNKALRNKAARGGVTGQLPPPVTAAKGWRAVTAKMTGAAASTFTKTNVILAAASNVALSAAKIARVRADDTLRPDEQRREISGAVGAAIVGTGGALGGAAVGAAIGSVILPGIGTAVGAAIGGAIGVGVGREAGERGGESIADTRRVRRAQKAAAARWAVIEAAYGVSRPKPSTYEPITAQLAPPAMSALNHDYGGYGMIRPPSAGQHTPYGQGFGPRAHRQSEMVVTTEVNITDDQVRAEHRIHAEGDTAVHAETGRSEYARSMP